MRSQRFSVASVVYEGKIVITGGSINRKKLKSVESDDHHNNK